MIIYVQSVHTSCLLCLECSFSIHASSSSQPSSKLLVILAGVPENLLPLTYVRTSCYVSGSTLLFFLPRTIRVVVG